MSKQTDEEQLLDQIRIDWLREGMSTTAADREKTQWGVLSAYEAIGHGTGSHLFIWVDSPMAGVIASTFVGFALDEPLKPELTKQIADATATNNPAAQRVRTDIDKSVWHLARDAVHTQVATELAGRSADAQWQRKKEDFGNYT